MLYLIKSLKESEDLSEALKERYASKLGLDIGEKLDDWSDYDINLLLFSEQSVTSFHYNEVVKLERR